MYRIVICAFLLAGLACAQGTGGAIPNVIDSCVEQQPATKLCMNWARSGDDKTMINLITSIPLTVEQFGPGGVVITSQRPGGQVIETYRGKIAGNRIEGTLEYTYPTIQVARPATFPWSATFFYPPAGKAGANRYAYAICETEVSIIHLADHTVSTVKLDAPGRAAAAVAVSPDSSMAYVSTDGDSFHPATLFSINGSTGAVGRFSLKGTPTPSGLSSLAISGDGSTLYGFGWDVKHLWSALVAIDTSSGAIKASLPLPNDSHAQRVLMAGTKVVLDSGLLVDLPVPAGAPPAFSSAPGFAAFPDGTRLCSGDRVVSVGTGKPLRNVGGCGPVSPDGARIFVNSAGFAGMRDLTQLPATSTDPAEKITAMGGIAVGLTADGKVALTLDNGIGGDASQVGTAHGMAYTFDPTENLMTDTIRVCEKPRLLGMEPLTREIAPVSSETLAQTRPKGLEAIAKWQPGLVVAEIDGKPVTAQQASAIIVAAGPPARQKYKGRLADLLEQLYIERQITQEAAKLHLDQKSPWKEQLAAARHEIFPLEIGPGQTPPPARQAAWQNARQRILWSAYFSQPATDEDRKALMAQKRAQYKVQVRDADFFSDAP